MKKMQSAFLQKKQKRTGTENSKKKRKNPMQEKKSSKNYRKTNYKIK